MSKEDFYSLTPDRVMETLEDANFEPTGEFQQLNSYENRVFDARMEDKTRAVIKFYRPGRWSKETILDEHQFLADLAAEGIPAVAPCQLPGGTTLGLSHNLYFAVFPKMQARMVDELMPDDLARIGRTLARLHNVGELKTAEFRPILNGEEYGEKNLAVLESRIPVELSQRYVTAAQTIIDASFDAFDESKFIRIHGDCHRGNLLKTDSRDGTSEFFFVDFDDFCMGPVVQDFWMLLPGTIEESREELDLLLSGYEEFRHFDRNDLELIPILRGLRIIHYAAWIARRWEDPSFPRLFPQFTEFNYWASETEALEAISFTL